MLHPRDSVNPSSTEGREVGGKMGKAKAATWKGWLQMERVTFGDHPSPRSPSPQSSQRFETRDKKFAMGLNADSASEPFISIRFAAQSKACKVWKISSRLRNSWSELLLLKTRWFGSDIRLTSTWQPFDSLFCESDQNQGQAASLGLGPVLVKSEDVARFCRSPRLQGYGEHLGRQQLGHGQMDDAKRGLYGKRN
ncbi:hypothetical protein IE53DRAFT_287892 [Violaceomyces palustris]|uniref:Uncharacterized protein n=1 Tax=Violaceomyces palustris TaxID=1673888 RepID=A0ACD0P2T6_9BASI|nr:hypothetical protein IE53DRAFT_287892 [Violaceomyces palustris]